VIPATQRFALVALLSATLFGIGTPLAKRLLTDIAPLTLAGLLYLGSGAGLSVVLALRALRAAHARSRGDSNRNRAASPGEAPLSRADWPWLVSAILTGGVIAPVLLLWGLSGTHATSASLLLNLEGVLTTLVAAVAFREAIGGRVWLATTLVVAGGSMLAWQPGPGGGDVAHMLAIAGACLCWAVDNNLTRKVSGADPIAIAASKGLAAGACNLALALAAGQPLPPAAEATAALAVGLVSYGTSLVLFVHALRHLGSARTAAHFGAAPFSGAAASVLMLGDPVTPALAAAIALMAAATWLLLTETHAHLHTHEPLVHTHRHVHDAHHRHAHDANDPAEVEPHVHEHRHENLTHDHAHLPDLHHRHPH
jgi:drug/metabolite transporter (DMT)-like permease